MLAYGFKALGSGPSRIAPVKQNDILQCDHSNGSYCALHFPVVLLIMLCKVVLTFESVAEILKCDYSNESHSAVLSCGAVYCSNF